MTDPDGPAGDDRTPSENRPTSRTDRSTSPADRSTPPAGLSTPPTVCKLGGSVITEKGGDRAVDEAALERAAAALGRAEEPLVVVHGGGSFGHPVAAEHDVTDVRPTSDPAAVRAIHAAMVDLNERVVDALADAGLAAIPVQPLSLASRDADGILSLPTESLARTLASGFVPVLHGDVVVQAGDGATVLSGDDVVVACARGLAADRVGLCSDVPGVLDPSGTVIDRVDAFETVAPALSGAEGDVTGGMAGKVRSLLDLDVPASIFGLDDLPAFVDGEWPGTTVGGA